MIEAEEEAQQRVREEARALTSLRDRLKEVAGDLPQAAWELDPSDLVDDPEVAAEIRRVIECVLADRLQPAIEDLLAVADYRKGEGGDGEVGLGRRA
ncbi:MAG: hypothetical protein JF614_16755 [Acidobacteria bacterium]|nr:hypothetical protein [Acidobacteriota bacterium]